MGTAAHEYAAHKDGDGGVADVLIPHMVALVPTAAPYAIVLCFGTRAWATFAWKWAAFKKAHPSVVGAGEHVLDVIQECKHTATWCTFFSAPQTLLIPAVKRRLRARTVRMKRSTSGQLESFAQGYAKPVPAQKEGLKGGFSYNWDEGKPSRLHRACLVISQE
jgi:hypothetical protein